MPTLKEQDLLTEGYSMKDPSVMGLQLPPQFPAYLRSVEVSDGGEVLGYQLVNELFTFGVTVTCSVNLAKQTLHVHVEDSEGKELVGKWER